MYTELRRRSGARFRPPDASRVCGNKRSLGTAARRARSTRSGIARCLRERIIDRPRVHTVVAAVANPFRCGTSRFCTQRGRVQSKKRHRTPLLTIRARPPRTGPWVTMRGAASPSGADFSGNRFELRHWPCAVENPRCNESLPYKLPRACAVKTKSARLDAFFQQPNWRSEAILPPSGPKRHVRAARRS